MELTVNPTRALKGAIQLPGSKSYTIRSFIVASCGGRSTILAPSNCEDALMAMKAAKKLGAHFSRTRGGYTVTAAAGAKRISRIDVGESGTTLRFILPLAALGGGRVTIAGKGSLVGRPNMHLTRALRSMGLKIKGSGEKEGVPIVIEGGKLKGGRVTVDGSLSSQFISSLLIASPRWENDTHLIIRGRKQVSVDYIEMTIKVLRSAGIKLKAQGFRHFYIKGKQEFGGLKDFTVPSDLGLAAFHLAAGCLLHSRIRLKGNLSASLKQADGRIMAFLRKMGARFTQTSQAIDLAGPFRLKGGTFSLKDCPDLVPIMAVVAMFAEGKTRLTDIAHARAKESNRISDLRRELLKVGAAVSEKKGELIITPKAKYRTGATLNPHNDHRLAMAFAVLGLKVGVRVKTIGCTRKSYPDFVKDLKALSADINVA